MSTLSFLTGFAAGIVLMFIYKHVILELHKYNDLNKKDTAKAIVKGIWYKGRRK